jgi:hypothetical protein
MAQASLTENGGRLLRQDISLKNRKALATKMARVFNENITMLSKEMQEILVDDLVTAFLSRLDVLTRVKSGKPKNDIEIQCANGTLELIHTRPGQG